MGQELSPSRRFGVPFPSAFTDDEQIINKAPSEILGHVERPNYLMFIRRQTGAGFAVHTLQTVLTAAASFN